MTAFGPFDPRFLDAIEKQARENWRSTVWRATVGDSPVIRTNTGGARWNPPGVEALYCSIDKNAAMAELQYLLSRQPVPVTNETKITALSVSIRRVVDLSTDEAAVAIGHVRSDFVADDVRIPQGIGAAIEWLGIAGLLVPSARYDGVNLVLFMKNVSPPNDIVDLLTA